MDLKIQSKSLKLWVGSLLAMALLCSTASVSRAELSALEVSEDPADSAPPVAPERETWEQSLINDNIVISEWLDGVAEGIDLFLAGKKFTKKRNDTKVTIESSFFYNEVEHYSDATSFNINLRLPNVEEYWMLTFTSYDETRERGVARSYLRQTGRERDYGASIGFFKKLGSVRTSFQPRVSFAGSAKISHSLTFESIAEQPAGYRINPKLEFYANADRGPGVFQALNLNFVLTPIYSVTFINEGDYEDRTHSYFVTHGVALGQWFSRQTTVFYGIYFNFSNVPNYQLAEYIVSTSINHMVYKNILDFELQPYLNFGRDRSYAGYYGVNLNVRLNF